MNFSQPDAPRLKCVCDLQIYDLKKEEYSHFKTGVLWELLQSLPADEWRIIDAVGHRPRILAVGDEKEANFFSTTSDYLERIGSVSLKRAAEKD